MFTLKERLYRIGKDTKGDSMIVVLCILVVLIALAVTLLLSVSTLVGSARKNSVSERCRTMAVSFSDTLGEEILGDDSDDGIQDFVRRHITGKDLDITENRWICYDPSANSDLASATRTFTAESNSKELGDQLNGYEIHTEMYWIGDVDAEYHTRPDVVSDADYEGIELVVTVTAGKDDELFKVKTSYSLYVEDGVWRWMKEGQQ